MHNICLILFLVTKSNQQQFWKFVPSNEFFISNRSKDVDLLQFKNYDNWSDIVTRIYCLHIYSDGFVTFDNCGISLEKPALIPSPIPCDLIGTVNGVDYFHNNNLDKHIADTLIFLALEGCCRVDKYGRSTTGTILLTNNSTIDYRLLRSEYQ